MIFKDKKTDLTCKVLRKMQQLKYENLKKTCPLSFDLILQLKRFGRI